MTAQNYPRDLVGFGAKLPDPKWPGGARIALQIAVNYEAGGEHNILYGDSHSEEVLTDTGFPRVEGARSMMTESSFEYGSRRGIWRVLRILGERGIRASIFAVASGFEHNPDVAQAMTEAGHEIVSHGWRWIDYQDVPEATEREHIKRAGDSIEAVTGKRPVGWMTGRPSPNTRRLLVEAGGYLYDRDSLNDELPYWEDVEGKSHLVVPYSYETNDNRFGDGVGFSTSEDFYIYMRDAFDMLYAEGEDEPRMMSLGLHDRLIGRPARAVGLARFLDHVQKHDKVWICTGEEIARHWHEKFPATAKA